MCSLVEPQKHSKTEKSKKNDLINDNHTFEIWVDHSSDNIIQS